MGSNLIIFRNFGLVAQLVEHLLCKQGVVGSNPTVVHNTGFDGMFRGLYKKKQTVARWKDGGL